MDIGRTQSFFISFEKWLGNLPQDCQKNEESKYFERKKSIN